MKNICFILCLFLSSFIFAQSGIYRTSQDYTSGEYDSGKIRLNDFISGKKIVFKKGGNKFIFYKDSIFGYRGVDDKNYRFYKSHKYEYQIVENKSIVIYRVLVYNGDRTKTSKGNGIDLIPIYFFSKNINSEIFPLNLLYLKQNFPNVDFDFNEDVVSYDESHNMFRINYLLSQFVTIKG